jgi:tetratricopeptide (TPR) repeat protein
VILVCGALSGLTVRAQVPPASHATSVSSSAEHAADLATKGRCSEALVAFKKLNLSQAAKEVRYSSRMAIVRCAMSLGEDQTTFDALMALRREFPQDPQVLYITTHFLSEMATRASQELAAVAPTSYQALELEAESFESQDNWDRAKLIYEKILADNPKVPGVHYRLGRVAVARPDAPENNEEAKKEFELELTIDPLNASAEFWLGELARRNSQWDNAVLHLTNAYKLDPSFAEAYLALGFTFISAMHPEDAIAPLERYVKILPGDPTGHYQLSIAYGRTGRTADQQRELQVQQQLNEKRQAGGSPQGSAPPQ